jgi:glycerol-3-phosphate acyltransferase PlsY
MLAAVSALTPTITGAGLGYILGSIPIANVVAGRRGMPDLRSVGDYNPGFWNAKELMGTRLASPILIGDVAKGALAALVGSSLSSEWWMGYVAGGAAMVGHSWPLFADFRGGRIVLAFVGVGLVVSPTAAATALTISAATALTVSATALGPRGFEWAARAGIFVFPIAQLALEGRQRTAATGAMMTLIGARFAHATLRLRNSGHAKPGAD